MSRLIVKGLPKKLTEQELQGHFSRFGQTTDVRLVYTRSGVFRRFGFVGYASEKQADEAAGYFNNTFLGSSRIQVEIAKPYGDKDIPRPWSKYSKGSSAFRQRENARQQDEHSREQDMHGGKEEKEQKQQQQEQRLNQDRHKSKLMAMLSEYYELGSDPHFAEFLAAHKSKGAAPLWANDECGEPHSKKTRRAEGRKKRVTPSIVSVQSKRPGGEGILLTRTHLKFEGGEEEEEQECGGEPAAEGGSGEECVVSGNVSLSDMDYLRSKVVRNQGHKTQDSSSEEEEEEEEEESGLKGEEKADKEEEHDDSNLQSTFTLKMRGLPFSATEADVHTFFYPLQLAAVRMPLESQGRPSGCAFVDFSSSADLQEALRRNKDCMGHRYIELFPDRGPRMRTGKEEEEEEPPRPWEGKVGNGEEEPIAESGRLFIRNLSYSTSEEDLSELFSKFGPLTELNMLTDKCSGKPIGLAFVSFMFPEHAVKAVEALDGQIYQGRLLHILPARPRRIKEEEEQEGGGGDSSYKKKKAKEQSSVAGSGHNWNTLFLGANAVVDAMADHYSTEKSAILDPDSSHSLAVRMALGETQLVAETRGFLEQHGVKLDVFEQQRPKRSKTIILIKNLPYGTTTEELRELFSPYSSPTHLVLPPHGVSALVEFSSVSSARSAFTKLAYTEFKHLPLYLEWAPLGALEERPRSKEGREEEEEEELDSSGSTQQSTIFVKNLNFSTTVDGMKALFSLLPGLKNCSIATKMNMKDPSKPLSMGYGFVEFSSHQQAMRAIKNLQGRDLDGHKIELKLSHRQSTPTTHAKKSAKSTVQKSSKILVRNIPFEATRKEVRQLFSTFGQLKIVRLPQKYGQQQGEHRGFGFVEYVTKEDAKRAMEALGHSTHLYGRRLVMEWAEEDESVEDVRKRTARYFHGSTPPVKKRPSVTEILKSLDTSQSEDNEQ